MSQSVIESTGFTNLTASALVRGAQGKLLGIFVASTSSGTIKLWDNTAASGTVIVNTFSPTAGVFYPLPANFTTGLYITIGGTLDCTVFWEPVL